MQMDFVEFQLTANWFQPAEASLKRAYIQRLIYDMLDGGSCESSPRAGGDENCTSLHSRSLDENGTTLEFLSDKSSFSKFFHESAPCSQAGQGLELTMLQTSSPEGIQPVNDSSFASRGPAETPCSQAGKGLELTILQPSFSESIQPVKGSGFASRGPAETEAAVESFGQAFELREPSEELKNAMPPIEVFLNRISVVFGH